ncbi:hypothetical protein EAE99_002477 [Botrytis elliptica]|nr:hypothetical protein EAE99_002477 [Botrytis elliptica]
MKVTVSTKKDQAYLFCLQPLEIATTEWQAIVLHSTIIFFLGNGRTISAMIGRSSLQTPVTTTGYDY